MLMEIGCVGFLVITDAVSDPHDYFILGEMNSAPFHSAIGSSYQDVLDTVHVPPSPRCVNYIGELA